MDNKRKSVKWKIFYSNGFEIWSYSHKNGPVENTPTDFVQVIVQEDLIDNTWFTQTSANFYVWDDRGSGYHWWGVDYDGLIDYIRKPGWKKILRGYTISSEIYSKAFKMAVDDPEFGKKATYKRWERRPNE